MSWLAHFVNSLGLLAKPFAATVGTGFSFEPFFQDTLRALTTDWRENLMPVIIAATVVSLAFAAVVWLRRARRSKGPTLHRSAWPARASRNQPNDTPLAATGSFRQRRRRRRRSRQSQ